MKIFFYDKISPFVSRCMETLKCHIWSKITLKNTRFINQDGVKYQKSNRTQFYAILRPSERRNNKTINRFLVLELHFLRLLNIWLWDTHKAAFSSLFDVILNYFLLIIQTLLIYFLMDSSNIICYLVKRCYPIKNTHSTSQMVVKTWQKSPQNIVLQSIYSNKSTFLAGKYISWR